MGTRQLARIQTSAVSMQLAPFASRWAVNPTVSDFSSRGSSNLRLPRLPLRVHTVKSQNLKTSARRTFRFLRSLRLAGYRAFNTQPIVLTLPRLVLRSEEHTSELQSLRHLVCRL